MQAVYRTASRLYYTVWFLFSLSNPLPLAEVALQGFYAGDLLALQKSPLVNKRESWLKEREYSRFDIYRTTADRSCIQAIRRSMVSC